MSGGLGTKVPDRKLFLGTFVKYSLKKQLGIVEVRDGVFEVRGGVFKVRGARWRPFTHSLNRVGWKDGRIKNDY